MSINEPPSAEPIPDDIGDVGRVTEVIKEDGRTIFRIQTGSMGFHARPATGLITGIGLLGINSDRAEIKRNDTGARVRISLMGILLLVLKEGVTFDLIVQGTLDDVKIQYVIDVIKRLNGKY